MEQQLIEAIRKDDLNLVKNTLSKRTDNLLNNVLFFASEIGRLKIVKYIVEKGANIHAKDEQSLRRAIEHGHLDIVQYLVKKGANISVKSYFVKENLTLKLATYNHQWEIVKYLLKHKTYDNSNSRDLVLFEAVYTNNLEMVKYLVPKYYRPTKEILEFAHKKGYSQVYKYLKEHF